MPKLKRNSFLSKNVYVPMVILFIISIEFDFWHFQSFLQGLFKFRLLDSLILETSIHRSEDFWDLRDPRCVIHEHEYCTY